MVRQRQWTKLEAAILLDGLLRFLEGNASRAEIITDVSKKLRSMAIRQGDEIDEVYRNENGISFQFKSMESAYHGHTIMKPASRLFTEVVELHRNQPDEFTKLLTEALNMAVEKKHPSQEDFMSWLGFKTTFAKRSDFKTVLNDINRSYNRRYGTKYKSFFEDISEKKVRQAFDITNSHTLLSFFNKKKYEAANELLEYVLLYLQEFEEDGPWIIYKKPIEDKPEHREEQNAMSSITHNDTLDHSDTEVANATPVTLDKPAEALQPSQAKEVYEQVEKEPSDSFSNDIPPAIIAELPDDLQKKSEEVPPREVEAKEAEVASGKPDANLEPNIPPKSLSLEERVQAVLEKECRKNSYGTTIAFIRSAIPGAKATDIKNVLSSAPWAKYELGVWKYIVVKDEFQATNQEVRRSNSVPQKEIIENDVDLSIKDRYPLVYKRLLAAFTDTANKGLNKLTTDQLYNLIGRICKPAIIQEILQQVSWASKEGRYYVFSDPAQKASQDDFVLLNVESHPNLAYSKPAKLIYFGEELSGPCSWRDLYVKLFEALYEDYPHLFSSGMRFSSKETAPVDLGSHDMHSIMRAPRLLNCEGKNYLLETNLSADHIADRIKYLLNLCQVDHENVEIYFTVPKNKEAPQAHSVPVPVAAKSSTDVERAATTDQERLVWTRNDQDLMDANPEAFRDVYYALQKRTDGKNVLCGVTAICNELQGKYKYDTVSEILGGASWSKKSGVRYFAFCDPDRELVYRQKTDLKENEMRSAFFAWLPTYVPVEQANDLILDSEGIIETLVQKKLLKQALFLTTTLCQVEGAEKQVKRVFPSKRKQDSASTLLKAYAVYLRQKKSTSNVTLATENTPAEQIKAPLAQPIRLPAEAPEYTSILIEKFVRGFRIGSGLDMKKFKRYYEEKTGSAIEKQDTDIESVIVRCGIRVDDKVFVPDAMLPADLRDELFAFMRNSLNAGKPALYYEALFREFSERFMDHYIYSPEMLKSYISFYNKGEFFIGSKYVSKDGVVETSPFDEVKDYLVSAGVPVESDKICQDLSHIPQKKVMQILGSNAEFINNGVLVNNGSNSYFHVNEIQLSEEDLDNIRSLIQEAITEREFLSGNELIESIQIKYPHIRENNAQFSSLGMRDAIKYQLNDYFTFAGNVISAKSHPISMSDVFGKYAKNHPEFTISELVKLAEEMNSSIYFDSVYENAIRIDSKRFVSKTLTHFVIDATDKAIDSFCQSDYIPLQAVDAFIFFPDAGFPWNTFLLESYVYSFSRKYQLLHSGFNRGSCVGALVKRTSAIGSFDELLAQALADSATRLNKEDALSFFVNHGFLARRNYSNIEYVLLQAKTKRNIKGS